VQFSELEQQLDDSRAAQSSEAGGREPDDSRAAHSGEAGGRARGKREGKREGIRFGVRGAGKGTPHLDGTVDFG